MFHKIVVAIAALRRFLSRSEWAIRLLKLSVHRVKGSEHGLILFQIDGLSQVQLKEAIRRGRMPFLGRLLSHEHYHLDAMYPGLPSSTPAVQAELFYGVKGAVPAFSFVEKETGLTRRMYEREAAKKCEKALREMGGRPLLEGGSSYSNVFSGGAAEAHFCAANHGWGHVLKAVVPHRLVILTVLYADIFVRTVMLISIEFMLAVYDFLRGAFAGKGLWNELKFIPTRVGICILLRELVTAGAQIDAARGLPIIHVNYLGYDEQSHRRGPASAFAHWSLSGIDHSIQRLWKSAARSSRKHYDIWIYSDHGQVSSVPYQQVKGVDLQFAVQKVFAEAGILNKPETAFDKKTDGGNGNTERADRAKWLGLGLRKSHSASKLAGSRPARDGVTVTAMGPLGHIYPPRPLLCAEKEAAAKLLVVQAGVPAVFAVDERGNLAAWTKKGRLPLPDRAADVFGASHPFLSAITEDLERVARHPDAGDLIVSGYDADGSGSISFQSESGAHGGLSYDEMCAFMLTPRDAPLAAPGDRDFLRPSDLRDAVFHFLGRREPNLSGRVKGAARSLRVMTYNVHSCIGMDGRLSPQRIARIIAHHSPDVVALQEIEVRCSRTGCIDQVEQIARGLQMKFHFHPSFLIDDGAFGNAILTRLPVSGFRHGVLPSIPALGAEKRSVLSVLIDVSGVPVRVLNTHLSIWPQERRMQARALCAEWLDMSGIASVLCGDFNSPPGSGAYNMIRSKMRDAQHDSGEKPRNTWAGTYPLLRIDHVFSGLGIDTLTAHVPMTALERSASDHLPLVVDLSVNPVRATPKPTALS